MKPWDCPYRTGAVFALALWASGCIQPETPKSMNTPLGEYAERQSEMSEYFAYHNDQGMLADLSIADLHFIPHSVHLSGTGEARLARYAELLAGDGGTLHYETSICDDELIEARLAVARSFLLRSSPTGKSVQVVLGLPGGRGMNSSEAAAGQAVAKQPEPRGTAYKLAEQGGTASNGG